MERTRTMTPKVSDARKLGYKPTLILTGDWHLREDTPICRTDDFETAQWAKVDFISELQKEYNCPIFHSGDLFNHWKPSPYLLAMAMEHLPKQFFTIYGNHDLPQHNLELAKKCGINVLHKSGHVQVLNGTHWNQPVKEETIYIHPNRRHVLVWHVMAYQGKKPWPDCPDPLAEGILRKYPEYDLILLGHNHTPFVATHEGRILLNPGSIMRQEASQINYKPAVWLYYANSNEVEPIYLPINADVVSREHLEIKEQRDERIDSFITRLNGDWSATMSFEENLEEFKKANSVRKSVMNIIYSALE